MQKIKWSFTFTAIIIVSTFVCLSCDKKKDDANQEAGYTGVASVALTNIDSVSTNFVPESMETNASSSVITPLLADFCEGKNFYACQTKLVKLYIAISKSYLNLMKLFLAGFSQGLSNIQDGDANVGVAINDRTTIAYSKTSATQYSILAKTSIDSLPYFYFSSDDNTYNLQIDFSKIPAADRSASDPTQGKVTVTLVYTDNSHWTLNLLAYDFVCKDSDPKAPEKIKITIHKNDTVWNGKAMLYNGNMMANGTVTCDTLASDDSSGVTYTEFIGDSSATKASVYLMKRNLTGTTSAEYTASYTLNNLCYSYWANFASNAITNQTSCETALAIVLGESLSTYTNPFCNIKGTNIGIWNDTCSGTSTAVSAASFDDAEVTWISPASLYSSASFTMPTTVD